MTIQVYCAPITTNSRKVLFGLEELKADYKLNHVDLSTSQHKSDEHKKINPMEQVPAATHDDLILTESNAILQYAADLVSNDSMYPKDLKKRSKINNWMLWEASAWFPSCYVFVTENMVKPFFLKAEPDQQALVNESPRFHKCARILNSQLEKTKWLTGDNLTIADIAVAAPMHNHASSRLPIEDYPHLRRWLLDGIEKLDSWKKTQAVVDQSAPPN